MYSQIFLCFVLRQSQMTVPTVSKLPQSFESKDHSLVVIPPVFMKVINKSFLYFIPKMEVINSPSLSIAQGIERETHEL